MTKRRQFSQSNDESTLVESDKDLESMYSISNFDNILLAWDFFQDIKEEVFGMERPEIVNSFDISGETCKVRDNPTRFATSKEYLDYFFPLFLLECQQSIQRAKQIEMSDFDTFSLKDIRANNSNKMDESNFLTLVFERRRADELIYFSPQDLVLIIFDPEFKSDGFDDNLKHVIGVVQGSNSNGRITITVLNPNYYVDDKTMKRKLASFTSPERSVSRMRFFSDSLGNKEFGPDAANALSPNSSQIWYLSRITSFSTNYRELSGLFSLPDLLLKDDLLCRSMKCKHIMKIPTLLHEKLKEKYNPSQMSALNECLKYSGISLIQGPPGTGKTTTIIGIISALLSSTFEVKNASDYSDEENIEAKKRKSDEENIPEIYTQILRAKPWCYDPDYVPWYDSEMKNLRISRHNKVEIKKVTLDTSSRKMGPRKLLVCAPSNAAIDAIVRKLVRNSVTGEGGILDNTGNYYSPTLVRAGPNFHPDLHDLSLEYKLQQRLQRNGFDAKNCKQEVRQQTQWKILQESQIVCATLSVCGSKELISILNQNGRIQAVGGGDRNALSFDTVIIDEASQGVELSTLIPLKLGCKRLILVGDPKQLPATVLSRRAIERKYDISLFQRLQMSGQHVVMLSVQYRMHPQISAFPSKHFYDGELHDYKEILKTRAPVVPWEDVPIFKPFTFFSVNSEEEQGKSISNPVEADFVCQILELLGLILYESQRKLSENTNLGESNSKWYERIAVISPYNEQVKIIRKKIKEKFGLSPETICPVDVSTVDGFQGQEKDFIVFSVVRSQYIEEDTLNNAYNRRTNAGFIADRRRINVALTRAKHNLWIVGNSRYLLGNPEWRSLWDYACKSNSQFSVDFKRIGSMDSYLKLWLYGFLQRNESCRNALRQVVPEFIQNLTLDCSIFEKNKEALSSVSEIKAKVDSSFFVDLKEDSQGYESKNKRGSKIFQTESKPIEIEENGVVRKFRNVDLDLFCDINEYESSKDKDLEPENAAAE
ncbi:sen1p NAM7 like superfamily I RNA helicase [Cryptosporidium sp. chipmunk genotype I]|uniref:sen1p NAM7 like superfamily I RNA helicase n=1 Tax=Cryptosporidium sp. chipmunk genotype I TaxID=1280935 RepID=UPI00351A887B|nr:sen1p NAM7 like superfamily I RNA helicase [Cryptosporidium sp. chipmunk genotype I]